jgi:hypothetical protein
MKKLLALMTCAILMTFSGCGAKTETGGATKPAATDSKTASSPAALGGAASAVVKNIYDNAVKRNCAEIPQMLTEDFKKAVGTSKDALDALCDEFTDSGKLTSFEVKSEDLKGDAGTVKVSRTFKDGKKDEKDERVKKAGDKWLLDS